MIAWKPKSNNINVASVRYRCLMPLNVLQEAGYQVELYSHDRLTEYRAVIFSKLYDQNNIAIAKQLKAQGSQIILDICDNHLYNPYGLADYKLVRDNLLEMLALCDEVVCASDELAKQLMLEAGLTRRPTVIGDGIEVLPANDSTPLSHSSADYKLLWFGNHGSPNAKCGMQDLLTIQTELESLGRKHSIELHVASNNAELYESCIKPMALPTRYHEWHYDTFYSIIRSADAVLIPISQNQFSRCKTNNRLVTALNYGVPVIADSIPSFEEFSRFAVLDDWAGGFDKLIYESDDLKAKTEEGMQYVQSNWSIETVAKSWVRFVEGIAMGNTYQDVAGAL